MDYSNGAKERIKLLEIIVKERSSRDSKAVKKLLSKKEQKLYHAALPYYELANANGHVWDKRHIDFSTSLTVKEYDSEFRDIIVPAVIFHDSGRYKTLDSRDNMKWDSFANRVWHMYEGMRIVEMHMRGKDYRNDSIDTVKSIVGLHDWNYLVKFDSDKEISALNNPSIMFGDETLTLEETYNAIERLSRTGLLEDDVFKVFNDVDRINVPASVSYYKDYYKKHHAKFGNVRDFALMRMVEFDLVTVFLESIENCASRKVLYTPHAKKIVGEILDERMKEADIKVLSVSSHFDKDEFRSSMEGIIDKENMYVRLS